MIMCLGLATLLGTIGREKWWENKSEILSHLEQFDEAHLG